MQLWTSSPLSTATGLRETQLDFLSFVDRARIPLHLIAGAPFEVCTGNLDTEQWFEKHLVRDLSNECSINASNAIWHTSYQESDIAVLLGVEGKDHVQVYPDGPGVTELLLYASASKSDKSAATGIPTPPQSSSPTSGNQQRLHVSTASVQSLEVKIYALPLSSHLLYSSVLHQTPRTPPSAEDRTPQAKAQFLPLPDLSNPRKRRLLDNLFDDATKQAKRLKRHGGKTVAKIMAGSESQSLAENAALKENHLHEQPQMQVRKVPKPLIRSNSTESTQDLGEVHSRSLSRTFSGSGALARTKRSTLHRVASAGDAMVLSPSESNSPAPELQDPCQGVQTSSFQAKNKNALSRTIMAGMRMHGLSQRKKSVPPPTPVLNQGPLSRPTTASGPVGAAVVALSESLEDEYKLVYHQTFKSAAFALRREMGCSLLGQDRMRDVVDILLDLFCGSKEEAGDMIGESIGLVTESQSHEDLEESCTKVSKENNMQGVPRLGPG